jgi:hypothetical protein
MLDSPFNSFDLTVPQQDEDICSIVLMSNTDHLHDQQSAMIVPNQERMRTQHMTFLTIRPSAARAYPAAGALLSLVCALGLLCGVAQAAPAGTPFLGAASSYALLGGTAVTCTDSVIIGEVGVYPGTAVTRTNCPASGAIHAADAAAAAAVADFHVAYDMLALVPCETVLTGTLDGLTLVPGVYCFDAAATLTGVLTLNGPADGRWIFKVGTGGTGALTATNHSVVMTGGAQPCSVYWWVAEAATLTDSNFIGTILAGAAVTITRGTFTGDALAKAAVTVTGVSVVGCDSRQCQGHKRPHCNQGVGNGPEGCDPGNSNQGDPGRSNDERGGTPGNPGRKGGNGK